ncbi:sec14 [Symbiodinium pilosum]|uniref:Sec14 protein n=1 Tax=Symbiodinium pilosum TaxID=2952 RepID=A0A812UCU6_SYMPI|nr:sec14 [Symbiodinium pilosum]
MDGFRTVEEPLYLSVKEENIAPFTLPVEAFTFEPEPDMVVSHFKNGDRERKIYCNIELSEEEQKSVKDLQEAAKAQGLEFFPSIAIMAGRFLSRARGDANKAIKLMLATQEWKAEYFKDGPVADHQVIEDLKYGVVYFCGRDYGMRPTIICRANRIPDEWYKDKAAGIERLIKVLIFSMEYMVRYMVVPGKIENNCLVVDLKGLGISGVPISALSKIYSVMSHHYIGRVFRFYVVNMSSGLSTIAGWVKGLLTDRQKQKLQLLDNLDDLKKDFAHHQLEEDLGGSRPMIKTFFPFPLQGPPFEKGSTDSCTAKPLEGTHKLLTTMGARGRIYDPSKTKEENAALEFTPEAYDFFIQNNLSVPPDCQRQHEAAKKAEEEAKRLAAESPSGITNSDTKANNDGSSPDMLPAGALPDEEEDDDEEEEEEDNLQGFAGGADFVDRMWLWDIWSNVLELREATKEASCFAEPQSDVESSIDSDDAWVIVPILGASLAHNADVDIFDKLREWLRGRDFSHAQQLIDPTLEEVVVISLFPPPFVHLQRVEIVQALRRFGTCNLEVASGLGLGVIAGCCQKNDNNSELIVALGFVKDLVKLMDIHRADSTVQDNACVAIWRLAERQSFAAERIAQVDGQQRVLAAMKEHRRNSFVQVNALLALEKLALKGVIAMDDFDQVADEATGTMGLVSVKVALAHSAFDQISGSLQPFEEGVGPVLRAGPSPFDDSWLSLCATGCGAWILKGSLGIDDCLKSGLDIEQSAFADFRHFVQDARVVMCGLRDGDLLEEEVTVATVGELLRAAEDLLKDAVDVVCECRELQSLPKDLGLYEAVSRSYPAKLQAYVAANVQRARWLDAVFELQIDSARRLAYEHLWNSISSGDHSSYLEQLVDIRVHSQRQSSSRQGTDDSPELLIVRDLQAELLESLGPMGRSPLEVAIDTSNAGLCKILVDSRANLQSSLDRALAKLEDSHVSAEKAEEVCRILYDGGVTVEAWRSLRPWEQCMRAATTGCTWLVEDLLRKNSLKLENVLCPTTKWNLALEAAITSNRSLMKLALDGKIVLECDRDGRSVLHYAALQGDQQLLLTILEAQPQGIELDGADELGQALGGHAGICTWLCAQRCDPAKRDIEGTTAFFQAICSGGRDIPQNVLPSLFRGSPCLVSQFFNDTADNAGLTLWHVAAMNDAVPALQWMVQHAEGNLQLMLSESNGDSPLLRATKEGNVQAASLLVMLNADPGLLVPDSPRDWATVLQLPELQNLFWSCRNEIIDAAWAVRWHAHTLSMPDNPALSVTADLTEEATSSYSSYSAAERFLCPDAGHAEPMEPDAPSAPPAQVCEQCSSVLLPDSNFCRQCGAPKKGTSAETMNRTKSFAEASAHEVPQGGVVHLQVFVQLGDYWLQAYGVVTLVLQIAKAAKFDYPPGWNWIELFVLVLFFVVLRLQSAAGCFANRARSAVSAGCFLALTAVLMLVVGYFGALQVYVLQVEFAMGIISLSLLGGQLLLGIFAGQRYAKRPRDLVIVCSCAAFAAIALVLAAILDAIAQTLASAQMQLSLAAGLSVGLCSLMLALAAGCCLLREL